MEMSSYNDIDVQAINDSLTDLDDVINKEETFSIPSTRQIHELYKATRTETTMM